MSARQANECVSIISHFLTKSTNSPGSRAVYGASAHRAMSSSTWRTIRMRCRRHTDATRSNNKARDISSAHRHQHTRPIGTHTHADTQGGPPAAETCVNIIFLTRHSGRDAHARLCSCVTSIIALAEYKHTHTHAHTRSSYNS